MSSVVLKVSKEQKLDRTTYLNRTVVGLCD